MQRGKDGPASNPWLLRDAKRGRSPSAVGSHSNIGSFAGARSPVSESETASLRSRTTEHPCPLSRIRISYSGVSKSETFRRRNGLLVTFGNGPGRLSHPVLLSVTRRIGYRPRRGGVIQNLAGASVRRLPLAVRRRLSFRVSLLRGAEGVGIELLPPASQDSGVTRFATQTASRATVSGLGRDRLAIPGREPMIQAPTNGVGETSFARERSKTPLTRERRHPHRARLLIRERSG